MKRFATRGVERKNCPLCGGEIEISELYQFSLNYKLTKSGRVSKRYTKQPNCGLEATIAGCAKCGATWEVGDFDITSDDRFIDYKYTKEEGQ